MTLIFVLAPPASVVVVPRVNVTNDGALASSVAFHFNVEPPVFVIVIP